MLDFTLEALEARLRPHFRGEASADMHRLYQIVIESTPAFFLTIERGTLTLGLGEAPDLGCPRVRFYYPSLELAFAILEGKANPMEAFMAGNVRSDGHLIMALQLGLLFPPKPRN
ncbi:MAG: SCP2 sterol-binding domain-containing protein [Pseudomonadales bacterium]|nr:SCP2 sterol-binding domain-containing protein [Pseudomonadales bacterium]